jgi:hypothetical protein
MSLLSTNALLGSRSTEAIAGAETLFLQPGGISADALTTQLQSLIPLSLLPTTGGNDDAPPPATDEPLPQLGDLTGLIGGTGAVGGLLGGGGQALPLGQPGDPVVQLGESLRDLGVNQNQTLAADIADLPGEVTGLNATNGNVADALFNLGQTTVHAGEFVTDISETATGATDRPLVDTANKAVLDFHLLLEGASHEVGLTYVTHGVTRLGETVGLGKIGGDNLLTDVVALPETILSGGDVLGSVGDLGDHLGDIASGAAAIISAIPRDLGSDPFGLGLLGENGIIGGSGLDLGNLGGVLGQDGGGPLGAGGGLVDSLTNGLDLVGSGGPGGGNLVTDALRLPGEILSGDGTPSLTDAGRQLDTTLTATGDLVEDLLGGGIGSSPNGAVGSVQTSLESFAGAAGPAIGVPQTLGGVTAVTDALGLGGASPQPEGLIAAVEKTVEGAVTDLSNDIALAGLGGGVGGGPIAIPDLGGGLADSLVGGLTDLDAPGGSVLAPVTGLLDLGGEDGGGLLSPVTSLLDQDQRDQPLGGLGLL